MTPPKPLNHLFSSYKTTIFEVSLPIDSFCLAIARNSSTAAANM